MIRRLELHNFATHEDTEIKFQNNKNIIIGQTGSGKTNILQAIDFAFLGKEQGVDLEELIADGAENAEVILDYLDPRSNQSYSIRRTLTRKPGGGADHECSITNLETNETYRNPEPVRKTLETLGVESSVFQYVVHVPQGGFSDVLQERQERKTILDRLFKVVQLEDTYHELGRQEGPIRKLEQRKDANLLEKARLEGDASKLTQEEELYKKLVQERQVKENKLRKMREEYGKLNAIAQSVVQKVNSLDDLDTKISQTQAAVKSSQTSVANLLSQLRGLLSNEKLSIIEPLHAPETREHLIKFETELRNLTTERDQLDEQRTESMRNEASAQARYDSAVKQESEYEKQLTDINSYLDGKGEEPQVRCDKCGSLLTPEQWVKHTTEVKGYLDDAETEVSSAKKLWSNEILNGKGIQEKLDAAKARVENQTKAAGIVGQIATQRDQIDQAEASQRQLLEARNKQISELRELFETAEGSDDELVKKSRMLPASLENQLEQIEDAQRILNSYDEDILAPQTRRVEAAKEADTKAKALQPQIDLDGKKIEMLHTVRTAFREIQPAVRRSFVAKITTSANDYLKRLYGGAEIENFEFSEDYEFLVTRAGHQRHAYRLSGGQQVLASMAFLMALSEVLSELDFLILDEPTTHLDESRRKELVSVLENLRRVPQLIIVDHHPELLAAADTRFQVTLNNDGQSEVVLVGE